MTLVRKASRQPVACGVDIGSTNTKVVALAADGSIVARASRPTPRDQQQLSIDVTTLLMAIEDMIVETCATDYEVQAICTAGVGEDGVLLDDSLEVLTPPLAWFDPRRRGIFTTLRPLLVDDETFDAETDPTRTMVGWAWSRLQPAAERASTWIGVADIASVLWSARPFLSDTLASRTGAWRCTDRCWSAARVEATLGSTRLLPPVIRAGEIIGELRSFALASAGVLAGDAMVVAGGHDHPIGGWGVHRLVPGAILDSMGTAEVAVAQTSLRKMPRKVSVDIAPGIRSDGTTLLRVVELARNVAWASQDPAVAQHIRQILSGTEEPVPVLDAGHFLPGQRGGARPAYALEVPRDPASRASAVLGALAVAGRDAVDALQENVSTRRELRLAGGWSRSPGWLAIKAEVNGSPAVPITEPEVTAVGAAMLAAAARGWDPDPTIALGG